MIISGVQEIVDAIEDSTLILHSNVELVKTKGINNSRHCHLHRQFASCLN